jgi:hypothetical protein
MNINKLEDCARKPRKQMQIMQMQIEYELLLPNALGRKMCFMRQGSRGQTRPSSPAQLQRAANQCWRQCSGGGGHTPDLALFVFALCCSLKTNFQSTYCIFKVPPSTTYTYQPTYPQELIIFEPL